MEDVSALVARLYEGHPYPPPSTDLATSIGRGEFQVGDPSLWWPMVWPEGRPKSLKILSAGCGSQQAAWFAFTNPDAQVFGIDLSEASLAHERYLQDKHALTNLHLFKGDLRNVAEIGRDFDMVVCTGVLHHMADPDEGMRALVRVMADGAALACMVYGTTRRAGVYMMQDLFRRLGVAPDADGIALVRRTLAKLPNWHPVHFYTTTAPELRHDAALVDTFLHPQDRAYSVPQVLALTEDNGLSFQGWFDNAFYYPDATTWLTHEMRERLAALPDRDQWAAMEMISPANPTHFFFARKGPAHPISFLDDPARLIPRRHPGIRALAPGQFSRGPAQFSLSTADTMIFRAVDDVKSIADLGGEPVRALFERLWKQGHVMMAKR
ncbi:class I SAM-dependent methyltransferase [Terricaulis sp.]|uniref:class I SAM-dependent methyltransferase n=1 Tax=Terricaulis sp. TaxID=2768686 RepID=UPI003782D831